MRQCLRGVLLLRIGVRHLAPRFLHALFWFFGLHAPRKGDSENGGRVAYPKSSVSTGSSASSTSCRSSFKAALFEQPIHKSACGTSHSRRRLATQTDLRA